MLKTEIWPLSVLPATAVSLLLLKHRAKKCTCTHMRVVVDTHTHPPVCHCAGAHRQYKQIHIQILVHTILLILIFPTGSFVSSPLIVGHPFFRSENPGSQQHLRTIPSCEHIRESPKCSTHTTLQAAVQDFFAVHTPPRPRLQVCVQHRS